MKRIGLLAIVVSIAGCAIGPMTHPSKVSIDQDNYECSHIAEQRAAAWGDQGMPNPMVYRDEMIRCLQHRGWEKL